MAYETSNSANAQLKRIIEVGIVYHYSPLYRMSVFNVLSSHRNPRFTIISDVKSPNDIKLVDPYLAKVAPEEGGIRWQFVKNIWLIKDKILWQKGIIGRSLNNEFDAYIFLGNQNFISTWIATLILRLRKKKVYFWAHGLIHKEKGLVKLIKYLFLRLPDGLFLYGDRARKLLIEEGFNASKLHVVYNSLYYSKQKSLSPQQSITESLNVKRLFFDNYEKPMLIFIGRLTPQKKLTQILYALDRLRQRGFEANLLFVGDGVEKTNLVDLTKILMLQNQVYFYGTSYDENDISQLVAASDLCISPGEVGLTAIHSLAYGTPVITHDNFDEQMPEYEAIVPGKTGDFFKQDNIEDLADKIVHWIDNNDNREQIREACYAIIDTKYNPYYQRDKITECLSNIIG